jgi:hypothetical protein
LLHRTTYIRGSKLLYPFDLEAYPDEIVAHELAHIWLNNPNESTATELAHLWRGAFSQK